jgi:hypothetical protein
MNSSLMPSYLDPDIFVNNISSTLYREHLENLYWTCRSMHSELDKSGQYIYKKICLHQHPHSIDDLPIINSYGTQEWYNEGELHRDGDLPAIILADGDQWWYKKGKFHRDGDLPAIIHGNGKQEWFKEGKRHRDGDLPAVIYANGDQYWFKEGRQFWYKEGITVGKPPFSLPCTKPVHHQRK